MAGRPLRVFIADDNRDLVMLLGILFRSEGMVVRSTTRGADVRSAVAAFRPDAVLLDIAMPEQSGFAVAQDIRAAYYGVSKPLLIAISGEYKRPADQILSHLVGFDHHLTKPCSTEELLKLLEPLRFPPGAR